MKTYIFRLITVIVLAAQLCCCVDRFSCRYVLELPELPVAWVSILGEAWWRVEWVDPTGQKRTAEFPPGTLTGVTVEIPVTWTTPVTASPFWHSYNLLPGIFKPAGALFPFDVSEKGDKLRLSWEAGPDAVFYWELVFAYDQKSSKIPSNFDWLRFRELFLSETLNEAVLEDPWLVDWRSLAERTITVNFDRRRVVPETVELRTIPVPSGYWYGTSPFAAPLFFTEEQQPVFPVRSGVNVWISAEGILKVNGETWMFIEF